jgi:hypothetical protein
MNLPVRIFCRTDIAWGSVAHGEQSANGSQRLPRPEGALPGWIQVLEQVERSGVLDRWANTYAFDFFTFRSELNCIAKHNWSSVRQARCSMGIGDLGAWYESDEDEMIYPVDDDDLFCLDLAKTAPSALEKTAVVFWPHAVYKYDDGGSPLVTTEPARHLLSNNWGVRKSFLRSEFSNAQAEKVLMDHAYAAMNIGRVLGAPRPQRDQHWWEVDLEAPNARFLQSSYGLSLKHIGSLLRLLGWEENRVDRSLAPIELKESASVPSHLAWAEPWIRRAEALFRSLECR